MRSGISHWDNDDEETDNDHDDDDEEEEEEETDSDHGGDVIREENSVDDEECQNVQYRLKSKHWYWTLFCFSKSSQFQIKSARLSSPQPKFPN